MATSRNIARLVAASVGVAAAGYATWAAVAWWRYGRAQRAAGDAADPLLDTFMPDFDVVERHQIAVNAPAHVTLECAKEQDLTQSPVVRALFKARSLALGTDARDMRRGGLVDLATSLGWGILADTPAEIVLGAVTRPWEADVTFTALPADRFQAFTGPNYVKIVWSLRADGLEPGRSLFRTETRAIATDLDAARRFRNYWALASPGIALIRVLSLRPVRSAAETRWRERQAVRASEFSTSR